MRSVKDAFLVKEWLAADADLRLATDPSLSAGVSCDESGCVVPGVDGKLVALTLKPDAVADDCAQASVMVSLYAPPADCNAMVIDQDTLRRRGVLALRFNAKGYAIEAIRPRGVDRPWSPAIADEPAEDTGGVALPNAPRSRVPVDATPLESDVQAED